MPDDRGCALRAEALAAFLRSFGWLNRGYEYTLMWGLVCLAIALRGGGPYSLDRKIGLQL